MSKFNEVNESDKAKEDPLFSPSETGPVQVVFTGSHMASIKVPSVVLLGCLLLLRFLPHRLSGEASLSVRPRKVNRATVSPSHFYLQWQILLWHERLDL